MLHNLQRTFWQSIYNPQLDLTVPIAQTHLPAEQQINIYRNSIFSGLLKALAEIYPVSKRLVGPEFFDALCMRYIAITPSCHFDINQYGQTLAEFTATFLPAASLPYLPDIMRLEWAWHYALQTRSDDLPSVQELVHLDPELLPDVILVLHTTATLLRSRYPVLTIWQVNQPDFNANDSVDLSLGGQDIFVWRDGDQLRIDLLTTTQAKWITCIAAGMPLGQLQSLMNFNTDTATLLQRGYICKYRIGGDHQAI